MPTDVHKFFAQRRVLVTGAAGSVGRALVAELLKTDLSTLYAIDNNETELFFLQSKHRGDDRLVADVGDVRDYDRLHHAFAGVDIVFHAAALKHVTICERAPFDAVQTNIVGVQNVIHAALASSDVERVIFMSSDKAVNPTNVMGTSKLMGERLITAANSMRSGSQAIFSSTRFGNVLGSRGSVVELFRDQIRSGGPVTLTDPEMTRFIMSPNEAVRLVVESATLARGGEVFVTKMPTVRIEDLARELIEVLAPRYGHDPQTVKIDVVGARPGEKMFEELLNEEELRRTVELPNHFVVIPAFHYIYKKIDYDFAGAAPARLDHGYRSDKDRPLSRDEIHDFLTKNGMFDGPTG